jgi:hypothetical protein
MAVFPDVGEGFLSDPENGNFQRGGKAAEVRMIDELNVWDVGPRLVNEIFQSGGDALLVENGGAEAAD